MIKRPLGKTGILLSEIGLGTWELSGDVYGKKDDKESIRAIQTALENGVNFIDTAAGYGKGHAEEVVGQAIREWKNGEVVLSTKVKPKCGIFAPPPEKEIDDFYPPEWIRESCEASLQRLGRDHIDILFLHTWSKSWGHRTEWYDALVKLKKEGKICAFGISIPDEGVSDANIHVEAERVDVIQCVYNIFQQEPEYTLFPLAKKHGIGIIARSPFSSGALIGDWTKDKTFEEGDWRGIWPKSVKDRWLEEQVEMAEQVKTIFQSVNIPFSIGALKYILTNSVVSSVIPGSSKSEHVKSNVSVSAMPNLSEDIIKRLKLLWLERKIHGTYNGSI